MKNHNKSREETNKSRTIRQESEKKSTRLRVWLSWNDILRANRECFLYSFSYQVLFPLCWPIRHWNCLWHSALMLQILQIWTRNTFTLYRSLYTYKRNTWLILPLCTCYECIIFIVDFLFCFLFYSTFDDIWWTMRVGFYPPITKSYPISSTSLKFLMTFHECTMELNEKQVW